MRTRIFKLGEHGSAAVLGPLEADVINAVWLAGVPVTVADVMQLLGKRRKALAYSTIKTILANLAHKGYLSKRANGRANTFAARQTKQEFERNVVDGVVSSLLRDYRNPLLTHLADELSADPQAIAEFERLLAQRKTSRR
jgi:predicted transcriptional regulator